MTREQVRAFDAWAIRTLGIPGVVLMENAGRGCAEAALSMLGAQANPVVGVLCGTGNNGGDGYVVARHLDNRGIKVQVTVVGDKSKVRGDARVNLDILEKEGFVVHNMNVRQLTHGQRLEAHLHGCTLIVDALFGTGLHGGLDVAWIALIDRINALDVPLLAVDIPSGLDCNTGMPLGTAIRATQTVSFVACKQGFLKAEAKPYTGEISVVSIGVEPGPDTVQGF